MTELNTDHHKQAVRLLGLKSTRPFDHKSNATFFCPFHSEKNPSFNVNFDKGIWHCFSCNRGGSLNSLCQDLFHKSEDELLGLKESSFGMFKPDYTPYRNYNKEPAIDEVDIVVKSAGVMIPFHQAPIAVSYLRDRKIDLRIASDMSMMYTEEAYFNSTHYSQRLLVPVYNSIGKIINVEGRDVTRLHPVKCIYPKGTIKTIYEHWKLDKKKPLYIVEGLMDLAVLRSDTFFENSSCVFGVSVTDYQINILNQFPKIILIPDNDEAGNRSIHDLRKRLNTKFEVLKIGNDFIKDVGDIPVKGNISVKEFRNKNNFISMSIVNFVF